MPDLLKTGSDWLAGKMKSHASQEVTYRRGNSSVTLNATIGKSLFEVEETSGLLHEKEARDFHILAADLILDGAAVEPAEGDEITQVVGGKTLIFECSPFGTEPGWRFTDQYRNAYRIHTKLITKATDA